MLELGRESVAIRKVVLDDHDVFSVEDSALGKVREVQHKIVTGDTPPIRQQMCRVLCSLSLELMTFWIS